MGCNYKMGIAGRGCVDYINGKVKQPDEDAPSWNQWYLEDNEMKTWIINSISSNIQCMIIRKETARDMWIILEQMYRSK